jgi:hypothetical protein
LESQFRCGKCGKPIASKFSKCPDCGSLGPHNFNSQETAPVEEGGSPRPPRRKDSYPAERFAPEQPLSSQREQHAAHGPVDLPSEPPPHAVRDADNDSRFPAGMRSRSPILRDIEDMDRYEEKQSRRQSGKNSDRDSNEASEERNDYGSYGDEEEQPAQKRSNNKVTMIVTITLVLILIIAAIYIVGNFDELTRWLASPTIPETVRPSN